MTTPETHATGEDDGRQTTNDTAARRGVDERREPVEPAQNPAPRSPEPDREAIEKGEEALKRVKAY